MKVPALAMSVWCHAVMLALAFSSLVVEAATVAPSWELSVAVDDDAANFRKRGFISLQVHQGPPMTIDLKNVRIRELP